MEKRNSDQRDKYLAPSRDGALLSLWQDSTPLSKDDSTPRLITQTWDVVIVGGGITGVTTALQLQEAGKRCVIVEAYSLGFGTTGGTTAHINTMLDTPYHTIERDFGLENAKLTADATRQARDLISRNVLSYAIDCGLTYKDGILFAQSEEEETELQKIFTAAQRAGVDVETVDTIPVPLEFRSAIKFRKQAQIHPLHYLRGMADAFTAAGGTILLQAQVTGSHRRDDLHHVETSAGILQARHLVYATHIPPGINILHFRCAPYRSYVLAAQLADEQYPDDLAYDMQQPYHYFRTQQVNDKRFLIFGGADHKTGHGDPDQAFQELEVYLRTHFKIASIDYRWSAQYFEPADGLPYIGKMPGADEHTYVATGYSGNGIVFGAFSALLLSDLILGHENVHEKLFSPGRIKPIAAFANFVKENADVVYRFAADRLHVGQLESLVELVPGTGAVVRLEERKIALYKSETGKLSAVSPICTHAGCTVSWNNAEKSWDCPCHGGRYDVTGKVMTGPPRKDLEVISLYDGRDER